MRMFIPTKTQTDNERSRPTSAISSNVYHVILSAAQNLGPGRLGFFATLRMTCLLAFSSLTDLDWQHSSSAVATKELKRAPQAPLRPLLGLIFLAIMLAACGGNTSQSQPDTHLKAFHILSERIIMQDNQAEVDGTIENAGRDPFPYDVTVDATFYDNSGKVIGQAAGVAEDVFPGTIGPFVLVGQVDSLHYSSMRLIPVSLRERRVEYLTPTPPVSP